MNSLIMSALLEYRSVTHDLSCHHKQSQCIITDLLHIIYLISIYFILSSLYIAYT
jgi:hypothetical protein